MSWKQPSHPELIEVVKKPGSFASYAIAKRALIPGEIIAVAKSPVLTHAKIRTYTSVQVGPHASDNIELNSDAVFMNHSCDPSVEFYIKHSPQINDTKGSSDEEEQSDIISITIRVTSRRRDAEGNAIGVKPGEPLTFFYPSTEWDMTQPFDCLCKTPKCIGKIRGAKHLPEEMFSSDGYFFNDHILNLKNSER